ncbi:MFS transporter [Wohlfahrtiimonas populi]|uniref:MFS transporter n=1 Tax=Wohlfahrtiimonas populi TaxID=1940240 RepID=UPI0013016A70|nr:MFS transporter [Wohlfahrtiimonas populi]
MKFNTKNIIYSNFFAQFSEQMALAIAPLLAVIMLNATASDTAWLQTSQTLPFLLLSIVAGLLIDRSSKRFVMLLSEYIRLLTLSLILLCLMTGYLTLPLLAVLGFIGVVGTVFYSIAITAYVPLMIPQQQLMVTNRGLELVRSIALSAGPAICGGLVVHLGLSITYGIALMFSLLAIICITALPKDSVSMDSSNINRNLRRELKEGWSFIQHNRYLSAILWVSAIFNVSWFMIQGIFVAYAMQELSVSAQSIGLIIGIYGVGMFMGAMSIQWLMNYLSLGLMIVLGPLGGFLGALMILLSSYFPNIIFLYAGHFLLGAGPAIWVVTTLSLRQVLTPQAMMGRVTSLIFTVTAGARPIGAMLSGIVAMYLGVEVCLWIAVIGFTIQLCIVMYSALSKLQVLPDAVQMN